MDVEMQAVTEISRKRTASTTTAQSESGFKKQKLSNIRKISVPVHRLVSETKIILKLMN